MSRRSPIFDASGRYWRGCGTLLAGWAIQSARRRRRHSWIILAGPVTWCLIAFLYAFAAMIYVAIMLGFVLALAIVGGPLSAAGAIDQVRVAVLTRRGASIP